MASCIKFERKESKKHYIIIKNKMNTMSKFQL
jgi:hypothetical protein